MGDTFLSEYIGSSRVNIIPPVLYSHRDVTRNTDGRSLGTFHRTVLLRIWGTLDKKVLSLTVSWFRRLIACLSLWSPYFDCSSDHVRFLVDTVALGQSFVRVRSFSPVSIISALLHGYRHLILVLTRTNWRILITIQKAILFRQSGFIG
jgi:hypothetical protein